MPTSFQFPGMTPFDEFMKSTKGVMPGNWKLVGIQVFILEEEAEVLATPGFYSRGFDRANYGGEE